MHRYVINVYPSWIFVALTFFALTRIHICYRFRILIKAFGAERDETEEIVVVVNLPTPFGGQVKEIFLHLESIPTPRELSVLAFVEISAIEFFICNTKFQI